ncbi:MAG: hypothetical protein ABIS36_20380 [Chryseolinea sp.]
MSDYSVELTFINAATCAFYSFQSSPFTNCKTPPCAPARITVLDNAVSQSIQFTVGFKTHGIIGETGDDLDFAIGS